MPLLVAQNVERSARQIELDPVQGFGGDGWRRHQIGDGGSAVSSFYGRANGFIGWKLQCDVKIGQLESVLVKRRFEHRPGAGTSFPQYPRGRRQVLCRDLGPVGPWMPGADGQDQGIAVDLFG